MEKNLFHIFFYYDSVLPENPAHEIDFLDKNDNYNPFSQNNKFFECYFLDENSKFRDIAAMYLIESDIHNTLFKTNKTCIDFENNISIFAELIKKYNLDFKINVKALDIFYNGFAKISIDMQTCLVNMFFQLVFINKPVFNHQLQFTQFLKINMEKKQ